MDDKKHTLCWVDIPVLDLDRAIKFYSSVLAEPVQKVSEHGFTFALLPHHDNNVSGCLIIIPGRRPSDQGPMIYLNAEGRIDEAVKNVVAGGGDVVAEKEMIGPYGYRVIVGDTEGNVIALYSSVE